MSNQSHNTCSCGETSPHVVARRETADGIGVWIWHDGAVTGRHGRALPGVPVVRPVTSTALGVERAASSMVQEDVCMYDCEELPRLYACARKVAKRGGSRRELVVELAVRQPPSLRFSWVTYATDRSGAVTCRIAMLDRIRWPGLVVWHERGRYELLALRLGTALGARSREALESTGFAFGSQRELCAHLFSVLEPRSVTP